MTRLQRGGLEELRDWDLGDRQWELLMFGTGKQLTG